MSAEGPVAQYVLVAGRVQGVGFRAWVQDRAVELGLAGWVRNTRDGKVEAVFAGDPDAVEQMIEACWRGPAAGRVSSVDVRKADGGERMLTRAGELFSVLTTR